MLVSVMSFRIFDSVNGTDDEFVIENTVTHQELVFQNRHTHGIEFGQMFDFEFTTKKNEPKFIEFGDVVEEALYFQQLDENAEYRIDDVDEMVGAF